MVVAQIEGGDRPRPLSGQARFDAADHRPVLAACYDRATGAFTVSPRTAVVFLAGDR